MNIAFIEAVWDLSTTTMGASHCVNTIRPFHSISADRTTIATFSTCVYRCNA